MDFGLDWQGILSNLSRLVAAYVLVLPVGWNRERRGTAGLTTFPLVAVSTCGYMLIGIQRFTAQGQGETQCQQKPSHDTDRACSPDRRSSS